MYSPFYRRIGNRVLVRELKVPKDFRVVFGRRGFPNGRNSVVRDLIGQLSILSVYFKYGSSNLGS